ncbi:Uncharacterised protein [Legionella lansingensis]|uniref:DUF4239 domain-containing protein n=1 Tax=Legionella lansingensis TaxID=45067 RepID=A0A0W0VPN1_9GAMM|nr:DUF4239 domain-containing protein [Legionella lansingensis]KTD22146.1 hypothetical protein Llan_1409 [Legionella lansingensis]SNV54492.1 Uncharacterised protein [Legionella lansingensis]
MFRGLINLLPIWQIFLINLSILICISLLASYLGSILIPQETIDREYSRSTDSVLNIMGSGYGVFLGFVIIALWNHYLAVQKIIYEETDAISVIVRHLDVFPPKEASLLRKNIQAYVVAVRGDEWEKMREGKESEKAWTALQDLLLSFQDYTPQTPKEELFYRQSLSFLDKVLKQRRDRLMAAKSIINDELRTALILGAIVIIFLASLLKAKEGGMRIFANVCLAIVIGFNLTLAISFDFPFSGSISVGNSPFYEGVLATL